MPLFSRGGVLLGDKISYWNRREIWVGHSKEDVSRVREILDGRGIKNAVRAVNRSMGNITSARLTDHMLSDMYYIYVHKDDDEAARFLIRR